MIDSRLQRSRLESIAERHFEQAFVIRSDDLKEPVAATLTLSIAFARSVHASPKAAALTTEWPENSAPSSSMTSAYPSETLGGRACLRSFAGHRKARPKWRSRGLLRG